MKKIVVAFAHCALLLCGSAPFDALAAEVAAGQAPSPAQTADEIAPYDAGFARRASEVCPGVKLSTPPSPETTANAQFQRGADMFDHYQKLQGADGACKAAMNLYDAASGKAARILVRK